MNQTLDENEDLDQLAAAIFREASSTRETKPLEPVAGSGAQRVKILLCHWDQ